MIKRLEGGSKDEVRLQGFARPVSIMPDKATNSLVIGAESQDYETLRGVIEKLDIRRLQVYVEALILEITADRAKEFGIEWRSTQDFTRPDAGRSLFGGTNFNPQDPTSGSLNNLIQNPLNVGNGLSLGVVDGLVTFGGATFANIGALLRALSQDSDVNVLSTPNLLTMDNEEAEIVVGQNVPFLTGTAPTQNGLATPFQTITREDIGIKLRLKPQISEGDSVRLSIYQEISSVVPTTINNAQGIITNKRSIKTTVSVREGQMIALGGLIQDDNTVTTSKVPLLGDLPLLGPLFRSTKNDKAKTDLMVFLLPHVIRHPGDLESLSREKYDVIGGEMETRRAGEPPQRGLLHPPNVPPSPSPSPNRSPGASLPPAAPPHVLVIPAPDPAPAPRRKEQAPVKRAPERESPWSREDIL
jgi:general secretion pathway protein D